MRLSISIIPAAALVVLAAAPAAMASAPTPFGVYVSTGTTLVTGHQVTSGERLVISGRPVTLGSVAHPGPAYVAQLKAAILPASWKGKTLPAVAEG